MQTKKNLKDRVIVIGSGFAGLSVATHLAHEGYEVEVFEKNDSLGGRARKFQQDGFTFDMGPSWYWMPDVFEQYFGKFGKSVADYYDLRRLDPSYRVYFAKDHKMDLPASMEGMYKLFEKYEPGSSKNLKKFLEEASYKYEVGINDLVYKPGQSLTEFLDMRVIKGAFRLQLLNSLSSHVRKYFKNPYLIELLEFPVLFLGAKASKTPALYSLMNYADIVLGTWYPMGGMYSVVKGMERLAYEKGVAFHHGTKVAKIVIEKNKVTGLLTDRGIFNADAVIAGADYYHVENDLLPSEYRNYSEKYWNKRSMAPSALLFYIGLKTKVDNLLHHNLFFDVDFDQHVADIYKQPRWPDHPAMYISCSSKTDMDIAPPGHENIIVLIPVAPGLPDNPELREKYYDMAMKKLEQVSGQNIEEHVVYSRSYAYEDFKNDYNAFKGNAYGLANTLLQTAFLKPKMMNKKIKNLIYTGQLTVPGPGVPPSIISGKLAAGLMDQYFNK